MFVPCQVLHINLGFKRIVSYWIALRKAILFIIHNLKDGGVYLAMLLININHFLWFALRKAVSFTINTFQAMACILN